MDLELSWKAAKEDVAELKKKMLEVKKDLEEKMTNKVREVPK